MTIQLSSYKHRIILFSDLAIIASSLYLSFLLRFDYLIPHDFIRALVFALPLFISVKLPLFFLFKLYRGMWRYTSLYDLLNIVRAAFISDVVLFFLIGDFHVLPLLPRSIYMLDFGITVIAVTGVRLSIRVYFNRKRLQGKSGKTARKRLLILGAGDAGEQIFREIKQSPGLDYRVVAFLDDDITKIGSRIHGVPIIGRIEDLPKVTLEYDEILIAIPSSDNGQMRTMVDICQKTAKPFKTLPGISEIIGGKFSLQSVREVSITDLIGRKEVRLNTREIDTFLRDKRVLITGAGGSIGSELVRQCLEFKPRELILIDNSEYNLFTIEKTCRPYQETVKIEAILSDVRDRHDQDIIFQTYRPEVVFHAAAYKHVPIQESYPWEAIQTNVGGTKNVIELSSQYQVEKFILVSTDKAVKPTSVMGATKRVAELLLYSNGQASAKTKYMAVRFGNVIGSSGSVIPIFQEQISQGGPVTVTHPGMKRYFMSIPEAAQLILQAGAIGQGGEIFLLEMGEPVLIDTIARELIHLSGYKADKDIPIEYIGLRPGEKMAEELMNEIEQVIPTGHSKIMMLQSAYNGELKNFAANLEELFKASRTRKKEEIIEQLAEMIPNYDPWDMKSIQESIQVI